ncbi:hypothetical protein ACHAQA_005531 [Verticillium albo-atrum]
MSDNAAPAGADSMPMLSSHTERLLKNQPQKHVRYRFLTASERAIFAQAVGAFKDAEDHTIIHPSTSFFGSTRGMAGGLYKDIVVQRRKYFFYFHAVAFLRWTGMMLQLFIGAALTGVGAIAYQNGLPITIMAGVNTVIAGMLAMLHNSGLPDRYRINQAEFEGVEDHLKAVLNTGIVEDSQTVDQAVMECFQFYRHTRAVVAANDPSFYTSMAMRRAGRTDGTAEAVVSVPHVSSRTNNMRLQT